MPVEVRLERISESAVGIHTGEERPVSTRHLVSLWLLTASLALAAPTGAEVAPNVRKLRFEKITLPNGLEVILHEDHSTPIVVANTWYHVGSSAEKPGRTEFAHLCERLMFMASSHAH